MEIVLKANDPKIGTPGNPPATDVLGQPYQQPALNKAFLGKGRYVVLPRQVNEPITVKLEVEASEVPTATAPLPEPMVFDEETPAPKKGR